MKPFEILFLIALLATLIAVAIPSGREVRTTCRRTVEASNIRQIGHASLIYANDNREYLPPRHGLDENGLLNRDSLETTPHIHALAAALARSGGINDPTPWIWQKDQSQAVGRNMRVLLDRKTGTIDPRFAQSGLSVQYIAGLHTSMPSTTPIAFTRGLDLDGKWVADHETSVYGVRGGYVVFLGGNVLSSLGPAPAKLGLGARLRGQKQEVQPGKPVGLRNTQGSFTYNVLETISSHQAIYSFPATPTGSAEGKPGAGEPWPQELRRQQ